MSLEETSAPAAQPVTRDEAKSFARVEHATDDDLFDNLIAAATAHVVQATGRQFVKADFKLRLRAFPNGDGIIRLPRSPVTAIVSVKYRDTDGNIVALVEDTDYLLDLNAEPATVEPVDCWPATGDYPDAVQVEFTAGYEPSGSPTDHAANVPSRGKVAIKALVAHWYENRPAGDVSQIYETPMHVSRLINGLRVWGAA